MRSEPEKGWMIRALSSGALKAIAYQVTTFVLPFLLATMTFVAGLVDETKIPWMWILMATGVSFAAGLVGVLRFYELLNKTRVEGKLIFAEVRPFIRSDHEVAIGIFLKSQAEFPIEFEVVEINTKLLDKYPPKRPFDLKRFPIPPHGFGHFIDHAIEIGRPVSTTAEARIDATIKYGRPGNLKHELEIKRQGIVKFDGEGRIEGSGWNQAA